MSTLILSITVGVLTGVIANIVTSLFINVWLPAYRDYVYKGIRVDGDWVLMQGREPLDGDGLGDAWRLSLTLNQKSYRLEGSGSAQRFAEDEERKVIDIIHYEIEGKIYDRFVFLYLRPKDSSRTAHSSFHLEVIADGTKMAGYRTFYGLLKNKIRSVDVVLGKNSTTHALPYSSSQKNLSSKK